jgi:hypothetical protein
LLIDEFNFLQLRTANRLKGPTGAFAFGDFVENALINLTDENLLHVRDPTAASSWDSEGESLKEVVNYLILDARFNLPKLQAYGKLVRDLRNPLLHE